MHEIWLCTTQRGGIQYVWYDPTVSVNLLIKGSLNWSAWGNEMQVAHIHTVMEWSHIGELCIPLLLQPFPGLTAYKTLLSVCSASFDCLNYRFLFRILLSTNLWHSLLSSPPSNVGYLFSFSRPLRCLTSLPLLVLLQMNQNFIQTPFGKNSLKWEIPHKKSCGKHRNYLLHKGH